MGATLLVHLHWLLPFLVLLSSLLCWYFFHLLWYVVLMVPNLYPSFTHSLCHIILIFLSLKRQNIFSHLLNLDWTYITAMWMYLTGLQPHEAKLTNGPSLQLLSLKFTAAFIQRKCFIGTAPSQLLATTLKRHRIPVSDGHFWLEVFPIALPKHF